MSPEVTEVPAAANAAQAPADIGEAIITPEGEELLRELSAGYAQIEGIKIEFAAGTKGSTFYTTHEDDGTIKVHLSPKLLKSADAKNRLDFLGFGVTHEIGHVRRRKGQPPLSAESRKDGYFMNIFEDIAINYDMAKRTRYIHDMTKGVYDTILFPIETRSEITKKPRHIQFMQSLIVLAMTTDVHKRKDTTALLEEVGYEGVDKDVVAAIDDVLDHTYGKDSFNLLGQLRNYGDKLDLESPVGQALKAHYDALYETDKKDKSKKDEPADQPPKDESEPSEQDSDQSGDGGGEPGDEKGDNEPGEDGDKKNKPGDQDGDQGGGEPGDDDEPSGGEPGDDDAEPSEPGDEKGNSSSGEEGDEPDFDYSDAGGCEQGHDHDDDAEPSEPGDQDGDQGGGEPGDDGEPSGGEPGDDEPMPDFDAIAKDIAEKFNEEVANAEKKPKQDSTGMTPAEKELLRKELGLNEIDFAEYMATREKFSAETRALVDMLLQLKRERANEFLAPGRNIAAAGHKLKVNKFVQAYANDTLADNPEIWIHPATAERIEHEFDGIDMYLVNDVSISMAGEKAKAAAGSAVILQESLMSATAQLAPEPVPSIRLQIQAFGEGHEMLCKLTENPTMQELGRSFTALNNPGSYGTYVSGALKEIEPEPKRLSVVIVVSDGEFADVDQAMVEGQRLADSGAVVIQLIYSDPTITVGPDSGVSAIADNAKLIDMYDDAQRLPELLFNMLPELIEIIRSNNNA